MEKRLDASPGVFFGTKGSARFQRASFRILRKVCGDYLVALPSVEKLRRFLEADRERIEILNLRNVFHPADTPATALTDEPPSSESPCRISGSADVLVGPPKKRR